MMLKRRMRSRRRWMFVKSSWGLFEVVGGVAEGMRSVRNGSMILRLGVGSICCSLWRMCSIVDVVVVD
jgi:hypothetical protein